MYIHTIHNRRDRDRPSSAMNYKEKHVMFRGKLNDDDDGTGSASSFQMKRTEAWRSSASSGSVALGASQDNVAASRRREIEDPDSTGTISNESKLKQFLLFLQKIFFELRNSFYLQILV